MDDIIPGELHEARTENHDSFLLHRHQVTHSVLRKGKTGVPSRGVVGPK